MRDDPVVILAGTALVAAGIIAAYPIVLLPIAAIVGLCFVLWLGKAAYHQQTMQQAEAQQIAARADAQHHADLQGNPAGTYGDYPPIPA